MPWLAAAIPGEIVSLLAHPGHHLAGPPEAVGDVHAIWTGPTNVGERTPEVDSARAIVAGFQAEAAAGLLSKEQAQAAAKAAGLKKGHLVASQVYITPPWWKVAHHHQGMRFHYITAKDLIPV